tara:strand:- start:5 stop:217 length:213 start_codon:yes stop_codon:yes gene_type:complete
MGQQEILELLQKYPGKWFTTREIIKGTGKSSNCSYSLRSLRKNNEVIVKEIICGGSGRNTYLYKHKGEKI